MQSLTILFSFIGLLSAGPQYYRPASTFSLQPSVHFGRSYGGQQGYGAIQYAAPTARYVNPPYNANVDIIAQTRSLADSVKTTLRQLRSVKVQVRSRPGLVQYRLKFNSFELDSDNLFFLLLTLKNLFGKVQFAHLFHAIPGLPG